MDAVDDVISVQDFLSVVENHILEDVKTCCKAYIYNSIVEYSVIISYDIFLIYSC